LEGFQSFPDRSWACTFDRDVNDKRRTYLAMMNENILWGDYFYIEAQNNFAAGWTLVHVEAAPGDSRLCAASFGGAPNGGAPRADLEVRLRLYIFDATLNLIRRRTLGTTHIDVNTRHRPWMVVLDDGRIVIVTEGLSGAVRTINAWLANTHGKLLAGPVTVHTAFQALQVCSLIKMPNNRVWVFWTDDVQSIPSARILKGRQIRFTTG
jgi:hypothetical protein